MDEQKMAQAWELFEKAANFEQKALDALKADGPDSAKARIAMKGAEKKLDEAIALEAEAVA